MRIARITPSRGLIHSRTEAAAEAMRLAAQAQGYEWRSFYTHDLPIPDCFEVPTQRAWDWGADLFLLLEEDIAPREPQDLLELMLIEIRQGADYCTTVYPIKGPSGTVQNPCTFDGVGRLVWSATGCIMFKRICLELMPKPWFCLRTRLIKPGQVTWDQGEPSGYGCDIAFTFGLYQLELEGRLIDAKVDHYKVTTAGPKMQNEGQHMIEPLQWAGEV